MQTYFFNKKIKSHSDGQIFTAKGGTGYIENGELHITWLKFQFIYKFGEGENGWYMRNPTTGVDLPLWEGGAPTAEYDDIEFVDEEYFSAITYTPEYDEEIFDEDPEEISNENISDEVTENLSAGPSENTSESTSGDAFESVSENATADVATDNG